MALEWFTYAALGERLGITPEAVRQRAIRNEWTRRAGNDGKAECRVDVEELIAAQALRPKAEQPADAGPTPDRDPVAHPADAYAVDALVASLREMVDRADAQAERERERAADERTRADRERDRADAMAAEIVKLQADTSRHVASVECDVAQLRGVLEEMRRAPAPPAWLRWINAARGSHA